MALRRHATAWLCISPPQVLRVRGGGEVSCLTLPCAPYQSGNAGAWSSACATCMHQGRGVRGLPHAP